MPDEQPGQFPVEGQVDPGVHAAVEGVQQAQYGIHRTCKKSTCQAMARNESPFQRIGSSAKSTRASFGRFNFELNYGNGVGEIASTGSLARC